MSPPRKEYPTVTAIRVSAPVRERLFRLAAEQRAETGRAVSMGDVIEQALDFKAAFDSMGATMKEAGI